ncbi:MAG: translation initiation factor [Ramlibacter sp.]|jgi:hypothetical protein|nr:translation initiation factor [Ramlibacter sp.]
MKPRPNAASGLVYSTDSGRMCPVCRHPIAQCGSGGTVKKGAIEVQGDHCDKVMALLKGQGHTVKRAGG